MLAQQQQSCKATTAKVAQRPFQLRNVRPVAHKRRAAVIMAAAATEASPASTNGKVRSPAAAAHLLVSRKQRCSTFIGGLCSEETFVAASMDLSL